MREKWFREHIWWMSFILSLMVVWVHSENTELFLGELGRETMVYSLENFFAQTLGQIAVPGFFMISAYLFYRNFQFSKTMEEPVQKPSSSVCFVEYSLLSGLRCSHKAFFCGKYHWKRAGCLKSERTAFGSSLL